MQGFLGMKTALRAAATSIWIILLAALTLRLGFMWEYRQIHPKQAVSVIPFLFESGNIAHSLATGKGFSSPFRVDTGPTAWMTPAYPLLLAGIFRLFGAYTFGAWAAAVLLNILCCTLACLPIFYAGKRIGGVGLGASAAWLWAIFPNAILIPVESMWDASNSALLVATILWATIALAESERMRDWYAYGLLWGTALMVNATLAALFPLLLGWLAYRAHRANRPWARRFRSGSRHRDAVLRSLDDSQLQGVSPLRSAAFSSRFAVVAGKQRPNAGHFSGRSASHLQRDRTRELYCRGGNCVHAREASGGSAIHADASDSAKRT